MTMYLPNPALQPCGSEVTEFLDVGYEADTGTEVDGSIERRTATTLALDAQTRLDITRLARDYIAGLVENHNGRPEDVRSVIHQLNDENARFRIGAAHNVPSPWSPGPDR